MTGAEPQRSARDILRETGEAIVVGVARALPGWAEREVERIVDAWGRVDPGALSSVGTRARAAGAAATRRVVGELERLLAEAPERQRATPLQVVRSAYREPTAVLVSLGIPPVVRDEFDERSWPDDVYGLVPHDLGALDPELAPLHLAWGMAKARVLRERPP